MNRRGFFATILGAIAAKFTPKPTTTLVAAKPEDIGVSIRYMVGMDGKARFDVLYGTCPVLPDYMVRLISEGRSKPNPANHKYEPNDPRRLPL